MDGPKTYEGHDDQGNVVIQKTAVDARTILDPQEVEAAIQKIINLANEYSKEIYTKLLHADASGKRALIIDGAEMAEYFEYLEKNIQQIPSIIESYFAGMTDEAINYCRYYQENENNKAYNSCIVNGVITVTEK